MIMIVAHHYSCHGFVTDATQITWSKYIVDILVLGGKIGVDIFILISGYFMVSSKITVRKLVRIYAQVFFYSVGITLLFMFVLTPVNPVGIKTLIQSMLPISYCAYWFATVYAVLMILSPLLNIIAKNLTRQKYKNTLLVLTFIWCIVPTFILDASYGLDNITWFIYLYLLAGYFRIYEREIRQWNHKKRMIIWGGLLILSSIILNAGTYFTGITSLSGYSTYFMGLNKLPAVGFSVEIFLLFAYRREFHSKKINLIASATFGVYLIHDNQLMRPYLWQTVFKNQSVYNTRYLLPHAVMTVAVVYITCTIIDLIRKYTVEKAFFRLYDKFRLPAKNMIKRVCKFAEK